MNYRSCSCASVVDSDTDSGSLIYIILRKPRFGHLENTVAKTYVRRRFTQRDLDDNSLLYILDKESHTTNDSFTFKVEDSRGNALEEQEYVVTRHAPNL